MPLFVTRVEYGENEKMEKHMTHNTVEIVRACMGRDPKNAYLNKWNQNHEIANFFVTDGLAFPSVSCVNP